MKKTKQGYIPEVTEEEFMDFLKYFTQKKEVQDILWDYNQLINRLIERKNKEDWQNKPHLEFTQNGILKPNYSFSYYDESISNNYFMDFKEKKEICAFIKYYLLSQPKRVLNSENILENNMLEDCKRSSALLVESLWQSKIRTLIKNGKWPSQCTDIYQYLLEDDLAERIELSPLKQKMLHIYDTISKRTSILFNNDPNLKVGNMEQVYLTQANYDLVTKGLYLDVKILIDYSKKQITFSGFHYKVKEDWGKSQNLPSKGSFQNCQENAKKLVKTLDKYR